MTKVNLKVRSKDFDHVSKFCLLHQQQCPALKGYMNRGRGLEIREKAKNHAAPKPATVAQLAELSKNHLPLWAGIAERTDPNS